MMTGLRVVVVLLAAALAIAGAVGCQQQKPAASIRGGERPGLGGDFTLTTQDNQPFRLQDVRGRPVLLFFGYTSCPDMCPMTLSRIIGALSRVSGSKSDVVTLFIRLLTLYMMYVI